MAGAQAVFAAGATSRAAQWRVTLKENKKSPVRNHRGDSVYDSEQQADPGVSRVTEQRAGQPGSPGTSAQRAGQPGGPGSGQQPTDGSGNLQKSGNKLYKSKWVYKNTNSPSSIQIKQLLALVVKFMLKTIFSITMYTCSEVKFIYKLTKAP